MTALGSPTTATVLGHDHGVLTVGTNARAAGTAGRAGRAAVMGDDVPHPVHPTGQPGEPRPIDRAGVDRHRNGYGQP